MKTSTMGGAFRLVLIMTLQLWFIGALTGCFGAHKEDPEEEIVEEEEFEDVEQASEEVIPEVVTAQEIPAVADDAEAQPLNASSDFSGLENQPEQTASNDETTSQADVPSEIQPPANDVVAVEPPSEAPTESISGGNFGRYIVQPGDTLSKIALRIYGKIDEWRTLAAVNDMSKPNVMYPGDVVKFELRGNGIKFAEAYSALPRATIKIEKGDTLASISHKVFGSPSPWKMLWKYNEEILNNPNRLKVGTVLTYVMLDEKIAAGGEKKKEEPPTDTH